MNKVIRQRAQRRVVKQFKNSMVDHNEAVRQKDVQNILGLAKICHQANKAICEAFGDFSQPEWEDAPVWQQQSAIKGVQFHVEGDHGPEASHQNWMADKINDGWKYGPAKDVEKKEHPCMVPFEELPPNQKVKDYVFRAIVHACKVRP